MCALKTAARHFDLFIKTIASLCCACALQTVNHDCILSVLEEFVHDSSQIMLTTSWLFLFLSTLNRHQKGGSKWVKGGCWTTWSVVRHVAITAWNVDGNCRNRRSSVGRRADQEKIPNGPYYSSGRIVQTKTPISNIYEEKGTWRGTTSQWLHGTANGAHTHIRKMLRAYKKAQ